MSSLNNLLHPHHVSLVRLPHTLQSLFHSFADRIDPYFEYDRMPSHKKVVAPLFNVTETETSYILDGEIPGVADKSSVSVMWLQNQVLMISGTIYPSDTEKAIDPFETGELRSTLPPPKEHEPTPRPDRAKVEVEAETQKPVVHYPRRLLEERRLGPFHRSFTFPDEVDADNLKANLKDGLLRIVVPKMSTSSPPKDKRITVQ